MASRQRLIILGSLCAVASMPIAVGLDNHMSHYRYSTRDHPMFHLGVNWDGISGTIVVDSAARGTIRQCTHGAPFELRANYGYNGQLFAVTFAFWRLPFIGALVLIWWYYGLAPHLRYKRRMRANQCVNCGYDLRGSSSRICPECGVTCARSGRPTYASAEPSQ